MRQKDNAFIKVLIILLGFILPLHSATLMLMLLNIDGFSLECLVATTKAELIDFKAPKKAEVPTTHTNIRPNPPADARLVKTIIHLKVATPNEIHLC